MKKTKLLLPLLASLFLLGSCELVEKPEVEYYDMIQERLQASYTNIKVSVITTRLFVTLRSNYVFCHLREGGAEITYSIEKANTFDLESETLPEDFISTETGKFTVENSTVSLKPLMFTNDMFDTYTYSDTDLFATMENGKDYLKLLHNCHNFRIAFWYEKHFDSISMSYTLDDETSCEITISDFFVSIYA